MNKNKVLIVSFSLIILALIGYMAWIMNNPQQPPIKNEVVISSFEECAKAGYPIMESYPARCQGPDGQTFTENIGNEVDKSNLIRVDNPRPNQEISSPLNIEGTARGSWYFEASFAARLLDANDNVIAVAPIQAEGEWMTTEFVPFSGTLGFKQPTTETGTLVLEKANASGLPEHSDEIRIPVKFSKNVSAIPDPYKEAFQESPTYGFFGTLTLKGYIDIKKRVCNPGDMCGETVDYASFVFTESGNKALEKFTGTHTGNSFVAGDRVGIGCYQKDQSRIYYINFGDSKDITKVTESFEGEIKGTDLTKLLSSSKSNPVSIKMTRPIYTSGQGAPDCYTHFRSFDVL
jgi:hypothetical protein